MNLAQFERLQHQYHTLGRYRHRGGEDQALYNRLIHVRDPVVQWMNEVYETWHRGHIVLSCKDTLARAQRAQVPSELAHTVANSVEEAATALGKVISREIAQRHEMHTNPLLCQSLQAEYLEAAIALEELLEMHMTTVLNLREGAYDSDHESFTSTSSSLASPASPASPATLRAVQAPDLSEALALNFDRLQLGGGQPSVRSARRRSSVPHSSFVLPSHYMPGQHSVSTPTTPSALSPKDYVEENGKDKKVKTVVSPRRHAGLFNFLYKRRGSQTPL